MRTNAFDVFFTVIRNIPYFLRVGVILTALFFGILFVMIDLGCSLRLKRNFFCGIFAIYILFCFGHYVLPYIVGLLLTKDNFRFVGDVIIPNCYFVILVLAFFGGRAISAYYLNRKMWKKYCEEDISFGDFLEKSTGKKNRFSYNFKNDLVVTDKTETSE